MASTWWAEQFITPVSVYRERSVGGAAVGLAVRVNFPAVHARAVGAPVVIGPLQEILVTASITRTRVVNDPAVFVAIVPQPVPGMRLVGFPVVVPGPVAVAAASVGRTRSVGTPTVTRGRVTVVASTVTRTRTVGTPAVIIPPTFVMSGGASPSTGVPSAFTLTPPVGADVIVAVSADRSSANITGARVGTTTITTPVAAGSPNNDSTRGQLKVYRFPGIGDGTAKTIQATGSGIAWWHVQAVVVANVNGNAAPGYAYGNGVAISQSLPAGFGVGVIATGNGGTSGGNVSNIQGATNRELRTATGVVQAINTNTGAVTMTADISSATPWIAAHVPLN